MRARAVTAALGLALVAAGGAASQASTPASSTLAEPAAGASVSSSYTGSVPVGADSGGCDQGQGVGTAPGATDDHTVTITDPAGNAAASKQTLTVVVTNTAGADLDVLITKASDGSVVGAGTSGDTKSETAVAANVATGDYTVSVCTGTPAATAAATYAYSAKATLAAVSKIAAPTTSPYLLADQSLGFQPATIVDPTLFGGEPGLKFDPTTDGSRSFVDWPVSSRTNIGVLFRSEDGGLSFQKRYAYPSDPTTAGAACTGRQVPICIAGGGGDTNTSIDPATGRLLYTSQVALANEAAGVSTDHGDTFPAATVDTAVGKGITGVDRQWPGQFSGTSTVFTGFHVPLAGYYLERNDAGGAVGQWKDTVTGAPGVDVPAIVGVAQSGSMVIDNTQGVHGIPAEKAAGRQRAIYVGYLNESLVPGACAGSAAGFAVGASLDGGKTFTCHPIPGAESARSFTVLALDKVGNLYAAWADSTDQRSYYAVAPASYKANTTAPGSVWLPRVPINLPSQTVTIFPNIVAGDPGRVAVGYYATTSPDATTPDTVRPGTGGWYPYVAESTDALCQLDATPCASPTWHESRIASKPNQDDNICTSGTTCAATMGNRNLLDYFDISLDRQGHLGFVWSDANNATLLPYVKVTRQSSGPSLYVGQPDAAVPVRVDGTPDAAGDAVYPFYGATVRSSPNDPRLDLLGTTVGLADAGTLEVRMRLAQATDLGTLPAQVDGSTLLQHARYVVRWDTTDPDGHGHAYYAEATVESGASTLTPGAGEVSVAEGLGYPGSASTFGNTYRPLVTDGVTSRVDGSDLVVDVPAAAVGSPTVGTQLVSVGSYAQLGADDGPTTATAAGGVPPDQYLFTPPVTVDSAPTFDTRLSAPGSQVATAPVAGTTTAGTGTQQKTTHTTTRTHRSTRSTVRATAPTRSLAATGLPVGLAATGLALLAGSALTSRRLRHRA